MKKKILALVIGAALMVPLSGCKLDSNDLVNVECSLRTHYNDVTNQLAINTYNKYTVRDYQIEDTSDGGYTITVKISPPDTVGRVNGSK